VLFCVAAVGLAIAGLPSGDPNAPGTTIATSTTLRRVATTLPPTSAAVSLPAPKHP